MYKIINSSESKPTLFLLMFLFIFKAESKCTNPCDLALASYKIWNGTTLTFISKTFNTSIHKIQIYNPQITNIDRIYAGAKLRIPFNCSCVEEEQIMGHVFSHEIRRGDTYSKVAETYYSNLTTIEWVKRFNSFPATDIPATEGTRINVTVNCSCGDRKVSKNFGLFMTYPLQPEDDLFSIANNSGVDPELLRSYNPDMDFDRGEGLIFIPAKDENGVFPPLKISKSGLSSGVIAGLSIAGVVGALLLGFAAYTGVYKRRKKIEALISKGPELHYKPHASRVNIEKTSEEAALVTSSGLLRVTVDKSVEYTYEELAHATNGFSLANKIGQGGYGSVYYAELRGEKAAIKKMDMQASQEFLAELRVLTHVHHLNLVRVIGYCIEESLFLVYEFMENGNLGQNLRNSEKDPLSWSTRVQIALDSARGLEYIHEHTIPLYIHRDIKSANILIDGNFRGKVADFGLTKLSEFGSSSINTRCVGTFGYMPPEYAQYGEVSPKIDVYAFGVVIYELISAKQAIVRTNEDTTESMGLVAIFDEALSQPNPKKGLSKLVDPRLGDDYPLDSVHKMAQLAKACTKENPQLRPSMRSIVVALMTLSSTTEDWDVGSFYENDSFVNPMSGR